jgi:hypothetical protein
MALAATGFIDLSRSDQYDWIVSSSRLAINQPLRAARLLATYHTNRMKLVY